MYGDNQRKEAIYERCTHTRLREVLRLSRHSWLQPSYEQFSVRVSKRRRPVPHTQSWEFAREGSEKTDNVCDMNVLRNK